jgi:hypothetical protein
MIRQIWFQNRQNIEKNRPQKMKEAQNVAFNLKGRIPLLFYCRHRFSGGGGGGAHTPRNYLHTPPEAFGTAPKSFCTPANYIYFDLIVSYLIILTTKFVKLPILWSQISPCRPRKQILLNFFLGLSGCCHHAPAKASSSTPPRYLSPPRTKI